MRLSTNGADPGFAAWSELYAKGQKAIVTVDGENVAHCVTADEEAGEAIKASVGSDGNILLDMPNGEVVYETLRGVVKIELTAR